MDKIFETIDSLKEEYVSFWEEFCNIESPTDYKEGVDRAGQYVIDRAKELGFDIEISEQKVSGNAVCITMNKDINAKPVCLSGHLDTVHPVGSFGTPAVKKDEKYIYGPGVTDCKGGIVSSLLAMHAISLNGFKGRPIKLILQSDEETSSKGSNKETVKFMAEKAKDCVAFLNCEGERDGGIVVKRKGIIRYEFTVTGKACHSSAAHKGVNAIAEAAYKIAELEKFKDAEGITSNCGVIKGGTKANTVAENCFFVFDFRFQNEQQYNTIKNKVKEVAEKSYIEGTSCKVVISSERVAMDENERNLALYEKIEDILQSSGLGRMGKTLAAGGSDAADMTSYGIPSVDSLGVYGSDIHSLNERAEITSLGLSAKRLAAIAVKIK